MTSGESYIVGLVRTLAQPEPPTIDALSLALGVMPEPRSENRFWRFYEAAPLAAPLWRADIRLTKAGDRALVVLEAQPGIALDPTSSDLSALGPVIDVAPNPDIPPEGTIAYGFRVDSVQVRVQITARSKTLRSVSLSWSTNEHSP